MVKIFTETCFKARIFIVAKRCYFYDFLITFMFSSNYVSDFQLIESHFCFVCRFSGD